MLSHCPTVAEQAWMQLHACTRPALQVTALEKAAVDLSKVKCKEVADHIETGWCTRQCNTRIAGACPAQFCLCDWAGDWPEEEVDFAQWDIGSLGIGG